jgi:hypothetical protein
VVQASRRRSRSVVAGTGVSNYDAIVHSINPTLGIDISSQVPLHEQVAAAIRRAIAVGEARSC